MATGNITPTTARNTCKHPGCGELAAPVSGPGRPPEYCEGRGHTKVTAWRERRRLAVAEAGATSPADTDSPVTIAKLTGAELLRALRIEADRVSGIADRLRQAVETVTDPTAAEAEVEAVRAAAEQRAAAAEAHAAAAEPRATEADQWRAEAEAAAEEMAVQMDAAQTRADQAEAARAAARPTGTPASARPARTPPGGSRPLKPIGTPLSSRPAPRPTSTYAPPWPIGTTPSHGPRRKNRPSGWRSRMPPARRRLSKPPGPRPTGSAPTRRRCWPPFALTPPVTATSCVSTCGARAEHAERQADAYRAELAQ
jgi:hypothetical protein